MTLKISALPAEHAYLARLLALEPPRPAGLCVLTKFLSLDQRCFQFYLFISFLTTVLKPF